jgi:hypothetical protein
MDEGLLRLALVVQFFVVALFLFRALLQSRAMRPSVPATAGSAIAVGAARRESPATRRAQEEQRDALAALVAERERLERSLALRRERHAREEAVLLERQRAELQELIAHRRARIELTAEEPELVERIGGLRSEVAHLVRRRDALRDEVAASIKTSQALRERMHRGRPELAMLRQEHERLHRSLASDRERLRDLAQRRAVLRAETDALAAELDMLQRLVDQPLTLAHLSDGQIRADDERRGAGVRKGALPDVADVPVAPIEPATVTVLASARRQ